MRKKTLTKLLSSFLSLVMILALLPGAALAEGSEDTPAATSTMTAESLATAVSSSGTGEVKLDGDLTLSSELAIDRDVVIDLDNHTLTGAAAENDDGIWVKAGKNVTIKNGALTITQSDSKYFFGIIVSAGGSLTLDNVTLNATGGTGIYTSGAVTLTTATINAVTGVCLAKENAVSVTMTGGKIASTGTGAGEGGIFSNGGTSEKKHTITVKSGEIDSASYGIAVRDYTEVKVEGGTIKGTYGITTNGTDRNTSISITDGTVTGTEIGIYAAAPVSANITGGKVTGPIGIVCRGCALTVGTGATIEATGNQTNTAGDDATQLPASAIVLHKAGGGYADGSVSITGGTIDAASEQKAVVSIGGGSFTITGGTFSSNPFAEGTGITSTTHEAAEASGKWTVAEKSPDTPATLTVALADKATTIFGENKTVADLGNIKLENGKLTGTANYIEQPGFNGTVPAEEKGHYVAITITGTGTQAFKMYNVSDGAKDGKDLALEDGTKTILVWLDGDRSGISNADLKKGFYITTEDDNAEKIVIDMSELVLLPKAADGTTVTPDKGTGDTVTGVTAKPKDDTSGTSATIPADVEGLEEMTIKVEKVSEKTNLVPSEATNVTSEVKSAIEGSGSTVVEVKVTKKNEGDTEEEQFTSSSALTDKSITITIGGLTSGTTYYLFCITDSAVTYCGKKAIDSTSLTFTTTHLCKWAAVEETDALKAANLGTEDPGVNVNPGSEAPAKPSLTATRTANSSVLGGYVTVSGVTNGKSYAIKVAKVESGKVTGNAIFFMTASSTELKFQAQQDIQLTVWQIKDNVSDLSAAGLSDLIDTTITNTVPTAAQP